MNRAKGIAFGATLVAAVAGGFGFGRATGPESGEAEAHTSATPAKTCAEVFRAVPWDRPRTSEFNQTGTGKNGEVRVYVTVSAKMDKNLGVSCTEDFPIAKRYLPTPAARACEEFLAGVNGEPKGLSNVSLDMKNRLMIQHLSMSKEPSETVRVECNAEIPKPMGSGSPTQAAGP